MIGGPPIAQPYYPYQYQPPATNVPGSPGYVQQQPRPTPVRPAPPVVRGQIPEEAPVRPAAIKLDMPSPEALGVTVPVAPPSWTDLRVQLDRIGATGFALDPLPEGGYRFRCQVLTANGPTTVEGRAATEAEAVQRVLEQIRR
jgi:hypothetical protein